MARPAKPVKVLSKHLTNKEKIKRKETEEKLKGKDDLVYKPSRNISKDAKKVYKFLVNELYESKILSNLDISILEQTVEAIVQMREARKLISQKGLLIENHKGDLVRNPATAIYKDYSSIFNRCCNELGLSPASRSKIANANLTEKDKKKDPLLAIVNEDD